MRFPHGLSGISLALLLAIFEADAAESGAAPKQWSETEKWVLEQVAAGKIADLSKKFPDEAQRKLSAQFLEDLLTGALPGFKLHRNGMRIMSATIHEPIDLTDAQIPCRI